MTDATTPLSGNPNLEKGLRLCLWALVALTLLRVAVLFASPLEIYPDEAQYWLWSRKLDFGYFSKPPMIAWAIALTTTAGNAEAFVRLSAPLFHFVAALALFGAGRKLYGPWTGAAAAALYSLMPGVQQSSFIISTDAPLLCFLALALLAYATHQSTDFKIRAAAGLGAALGLAMLSKYAALYAVIGIVLHLALSSQARQAWTLKAAGTTIGVFLLVLAPNLIWNAAHHFATVGHTAANADWGAGRLFNPGEMASFLGAQFGVFGPIPFAVLLGGLILLAVRRKLAGPDLLLACLTLPPLLVVTVQAFISRANDNWAASAYVAGSVLAAALLTRPWPGRWRRVAPVLLAIAIGLQGLLVVAVEIGLANPRLIDKAGFANSIKRVRGWKAMSEAILDEADLAAANGGLTAIAVDNRFLFNTMAYYQRDYFSRPDALPLRMWVKRAEAGNQAEAESPLTPAQGRRVIVASFEGRNVGAISQDFAAASVVRTTRDFLSLPCAQKPKETPAHYDNRCVRRMSVILGEGFRPVAR
ncbi:4-amino-4-deoxy-L-arabinose transferase-like glycosyltransferase [Caulobacter ginsengisoli]|uniref:4-amino-4-deoxy-L-arabinose transferase-like glycosyltransferase n=1 Tax=Caulobacter ginsengisoli TaxID=400775 RepID=A0ABU0IWZ1_9CAUL|nr:glycosyltransferase family 39 protein [Caulobacter ginsengisoli]MDQ0466505.1 4-amino-4-deoxy-L-arabinose transferase-like glycosyltransferase [Caulobacter ginsengisoli]